MNDAPLAKCGSRAKSLGPPLSVNEPSPLTRDQRRSRRRHQTRARTISVKRMTKRELEIGRILYPPTEYERPKTRAECKNGIRPCPFVSCKHHLYLDVNPETGSIKLNFPDVEVWEMGRTCALDVADKGPGKLEEVGAIMNITRERIRQVEVVALERLKSSVLAHQVEGERREPVRVLPDDWDFDESDLEPGDE